MIFFNRLLVKLIKLSNRLIFLSAFLLILISSFAIYWLEPDTFGHPFNGFWWVMTTVTTVGYGDFYPHTVAGKLLAIILYIFGIGLISIIISKVIDSLFIYNRMKEAGKLRYMDENHFVMIGWTKNSEVAVHEILNTNASVEIVLIDNMKSTPISHNRVHYIHGNPVHKETLDMANIAKSKAVFIFAVDTTENQNFIRDTSFIDGKTLLIATSVERHFNHVYTIVEIKDKENIMNFLHVKIDEFILGTETIAQLAVRSAFSPGTSKIVSQLLSTQEGEDLFEIKKRPHWDNYRDAFEELLLEGATLISDGEHMNINRRLDERISETARLFVICDQDTYMKLKQ